jgi:hypothetical protein
MLNLSFRASVELQLLKMDPSRRKDGPKCSLTLYYSVKNLQNYLRPVRRLQENSLTQSCW